MFERLPTGYQPTEAGVRLIGAAERIEAEALALERDLTGRDARLSGRVRVTCSETLAYRLLTAELGRFAELHPGIAVELVIDNRQLDLSRREADVALRATRPVQRELFGRKLATMGWAIYGSLDHLDRHGTPLSVADLGRHRMVGWGETALPVRAAEWLAETVPAEAVVYRTASLINQLMAVKAGIGLAALPCYLADPEPDLRRVLGPVAGARPRAVADHARGPEGHGPHPRLHGGGGRGAIGKEGTARGRLKLSPDARARSRAARGAGGSGRWSSR